MACAMALLVLAVVSSSSAQQQDPESVSNPYQDEYEYAIGELLDPGVVIDGIRWSQLRVAPRAARNPQAGKQIPVDVTLSFESSRNDGVAVQVTLLLEDDQGRQLDRIQCEPFRIGGDRSKEINQKHKVWGDALLGTGRVYVFCSVE
jgi:hypothetical protein